VGIPNADESLDTASASRQIGIIDIKGGSLDFVGSTTARVVPFSGVEPGYGVLVGQSIILRLSVTCAEFEPTPPIA